MAGVRSALGDDTSAGIHGPELFLLVCDELKRLVADQSAIDEIRAILRLSETDLATLIGVRRQAVTQWRVRGIPADRAPLVDQYLEMARYLSTSFAPDRIPAIIRRPVPSLAGKSWLDNMRERGPEDTQNQLRAVLSYQLM
jgi:DNA-binding XRE family transcriptional regulator